MAIDRAGARRRVATVTGWAAAGAAALTAAFAVGAARGNHAAAKTPTRSPRTSGDLQVPDTQAPDQGYGQGYTPPAASQAPPSAMSGGS
jgi:hypothetical protein